MGRPASWGLCREQVWIVQGWKMAAPDTYWFAQGQRRPILSFFDQQGLLHQAQPTQACAGEHTVETGVWAAQLQESRGPCSQGSPWGF